MYYTTTHTSSKRCWSDWIPFDCCISLINQHFTWARTAATTLDIIKTGRLKHLQTVLCWCGMISSWPHERLIIIRDNYTLEEVNSKLLFCESWTVQISKLSQSDIEGQRAFSKHFKPLRVDCRPRGCEHLCHLSSLPVIQAVVSPSMRMCALMYTHWQNNVGKEYSDLKIICSACKQELGLRVFGFITKVDWLGTRGHEWWHQKPSHVRKLKNTRYRGCLVNALAALKHCLIADAYFCYVSSLVVRSCKGPTFEEYMSQ